MTKSQLSVEQAKLAGWDFEEADTNNDNELSLDEWLAFSTRFARLDDAYVIDACQSERGIHPLPSALRLLWCRGSFCLACFGSAPSDAIAGHGLVSGTSPGRCCRS